MPDHAPTKTTTTTTTKTTTKTASVVKKNDSSSTTSASSPLIVPTPSTLSLDPEDEREMEAARKAEAGATGLEAQQEQTSTTVDVGSKEEVAKHDHSQSKKKKNAKSNKKGKHVKVKKAKKAKVESSSEDDSSDSSDSDSDSSSDSDSDSEDERSRRRKKRKAALKEKAKKKAKAKAKAKAKKHKSKKYDSSSEDSDSDSNSSSSSSDSDSESESDKKRRKRKAAKKSKKSKKVESSSESSSSSSSEGETAEAAPDATAISTDDLTEERLTELLTQLRLEKALAAAASPPVPETTTTTTKKAESKTKESKKGKLEFKRVDQVWDKKIHDWKITESSEEAKDEFDCVFTVRRLFDWENKYTNTVVDIKSNLLQNALKEVMKDVKGQSLVEETPALDPNLLFLYYDELKTYYKKTLKKQLRKEKKRKQKKKLTQQIAHCKLLAGYIDKDYDPIRKRLYPMLKSGNITFDLMWALFKPNSILYTPTYGNKEDPRCFKVDYAGKWNDWMTGEYWRIDGRYLEYDGKKFGLGEHMVRVNHFKGPRKITSMDCYPLTYHKDPEALRKQLIERGKKFVALQGMNYRFQRGLAYQKVKRTVAKHNIDGRVMVDPAIFRRINANYPLSYMKHMEDDSDDESDDEGCGCEDSEDSDDESEEEKTRTKIFRDKKGKFHMVQVPVGSKGPDLTAQKLDPTESDDGEWLSFTEEELLIASPVVLGFSFSTKLWLEFSLQGIREIEWNSDAFDSLVMPTTIKQNLKGLVSSHRFNAAKTIDDVIQGKGKGLNVVLHGPPGVGKTLTGESIADFLKCPLYAVSAGELGTNSRQLEADLNRIMDITHSWGAILLLDEADVFLEQRQAQDVHRNALVSVFLRLLEYYQGILFLTTNRVETFDEAFQSRIHMGIPYQNLTHKARKEIWQHHIKKVENMKGQEFTVFKDGDFEELAKKVLNGRQIKNNVATAQSIALSEDKPFSFAYVKRVLEVAEDFENDMRGGRGYRDAMRQYT